MAIRIIWVLQLLLALASFMALAFDPNSLQDFCVADETSSVQVNGFTCKDPKMVSANDFFFTGLDKPGNTSNPVGSKVTLINVSKIPGLNTLGLSLARIDYAPWGLNPPHTHPRATEVFTVIKGTIQAGFITSNPDNRFITKVLQEGDVFVFPAGMVHFQRNLRNSHAFAISGLSSQNPGINTIANVVFGATPEIPDDVLAKAFQLDQNVVKYLQSKF